MNNRFITIAELAALLGVTTEAMRLRLGRNPDDYPPKIKLGARTVRFDAATVERWMKARNAKGEKLYG